MTSYPLLPQSFYQQPTLELAQSLLGCLLVHETSEGITSGYIVETEAYRGALDRAAHSFNNRRTKRTEIMFQTPGYIYTYTMHRQVLLNVVSADAEIPEAVLIRALEPKDGIPLMETRRPDRKPRELTNGPGKLCQAMGIIQSHYGGHFTKSPLYIAPGYTPEQVEIGPRIGIPNAQEAKDFPWRFWVHGNRYVSR
ncbi:DNA-3-methyladenine glycosylase [Terribacillus saccharophilus]|uniref:Putative 3-methyladenine DNA glycosylase n=1 Tax=Terribacillus saccharophilus TaxID=361277 RepID=A0A268A8A5_9BACI|nr:DNA-3-methyladenine glycosylase [Terribacillus saccharophilus]PAD20350.1 3-methyladenine DNA glycosylase [Terribacillus saccharophilus]PAF20709.1 3-methyladenine DNA glycosylase [Terribacillus saccharophilus]